MAKPKRHSLIDFTSLKDMNHIVISWRSIGHPVSSSKGPLLWNSRVALFGASWRLGWVYDESDVGKQNHSVRDRKLFLNQFPRSEKSNSDHVNN